MLKGCKAAIIRLFVFFLITAVFFCVEDTGFAEVKLKDTGDYVFTMTPYFRTDAVMLKNTVDLDSGNSDDSSSYIGVDYSFGFDLKSKASGNEFYLKLERNGPYDYSAPLFINNTLATSSARVERYRGKDLLPQVEEFWADFRIPSSPMRVKSGLYTYEVGHGLSLSGEYENYGASLYSENENFQWRFYYCRPDFVNKSYLAFSRPEQDKQQGINYERARANFFAFDAAIPLKKEHTLQPYVGILVDNTNAKRASYFTNPTRKDILGTLGASWEGKLDKFSFGIEAARNFGKAKSSDEAYKDVEHAGYAVCVDSKYDFDKFSPHASFLYASGNKITTEMVDNADTTLTSGKNRAFSSYSPFNYTLSDSHYPGFDNMPLVAMGNGNGLNYGIQRPGTFADPRLPENLGLFGLGFDYSLSEKLSFTFDWWHLRAVERGIGTYAGNSKMLSRDLGDEIDIYWNYTVNDNVSIDLSGGYFFPGRYYKETRDDPGCLFTPFVRGDGEANNAYQIELSTTISF